MRVWTRSSSAFRCAASLSTAVCQGVHRHRARSDTRSGRGKHKRASRQQRRFWDSADCKEFGLTSCQCNASGSVGDGRYRNYWKAVHSHMRRHRSPKLLLALIVAAVRSECLSATCCRCRFQPRCCAAQAGSQHRSEGLARKHG